LRSALNQLTGEEGQTAVGLAEGKAGCVPDGQFATQTWLRHQGGKSTGPPVVADDVAAPRPDTRSRPRERKDIFADMDKNGETISLKVVVS
jgi:hypothetical protein